MNDSTTKPAPPEPKGKPFYTRPKFIMSAIAGVVFLILIFQNWKSVSVNLFFVTDLQIPAALVYIACAIIGFSVGWLLKRSHAAAKASK